MLRYTDITGAKIDKVQTAIDRLKSFEPPDGYYLAFSGGKDSCCIKELANMAGVKYDAHYSVTTVDPPELTRYIRQHHPDVIWERPEMPMRKLIVKKLMPPTRIVRYCCQVLKEGGGQGRVVVTGVRWAESVARRKRHGVATIFNQQVFLDDNDEARRMVEQCYQKQTTTVNPIVDWLNEDVWEFIRANNLPYCSLYDEGFKRLGCVGCPISGTNGMTKDFDRWPQYKKLYIKSFDEMLKERAAKGKKTKWETGEDVFNWWVNGGAEKIDKNQILMDMAPNGDEGERE